MSAGEKSAEAVVAKKQGNASGAKGGRSKTELERGRKGTCGRYPLAVWPAALEVRHPIDAIIERTRKVEIIGDQRFDGRTILGDVRLIARARDGQCLFPDS